MSSRELLRTYASILTELVKRGVTRSRNAPVGELAELLVQRAYGGILAPSNAKSWDVESADGRNIQVKARLVVPGATRAEQYSPFRSWDFDVCVFITFDAHTYDVLLALEVPAVEVQQLATAVPHVGATAARVSTRTPLGAAPGAVDVTPQVRAAMSELE
ncbi:hypothetical protein DV701_07430 [Ornithinimicrobium avium]|uniref:DUF6998 domain-containing protein n=2 Tax=Ornithinimicrobium avium TaxID=2283195 RepID=A0A345NLS0_9MICO|nr:hypothetical protein DV701_07430 [Ornithinimicrobium avium]